MAHIATGIAVAVVIALPDALLAVVIEAALAVLIAKPRPVGKLALVIATRVPAHIGHAAHPVRRTALGMILTWLLA